MLISLRHSVFASLREIKGFGNSAGSYMPTSPTRPGTRLKECDDEPQGPWNQDQWIDYNFSRKIVICSDIRRANQWNCVTPTQ